MIKVSLNYHPLSLTTIILKLMKSIIKDSLTEFPVSTIYCKMHTLLFSQIDQQSFAFILNLIKGLSQSNIPNDHIR